jgi:hypothetical protein
VDEEPEVKNDEIDVTRTASADSGGNPPGRTISEGDEGGESEVSGDKRPESGG